MTLWYLIRGLGLAALLALTTTTALGALSTGGGPGAAALDRRAVRQLVHRSTAVLGLALLGLHLACVALDSYVSIPLRSFVLPFTSGYRPLAMGLGSLALYAFVLAAVSGFARGRLARLPGSDRLWRPVHAAAYAGWLLALGHGFLGGTDSSQTWARVTYVTCAAVVGGAVLVRLRFRPRRERTAGGHRRFPVPSGALR